MASLRLTAVGTSTGIVIPKEMLRRLKVARGDTLFVIETPSGYVLTPYEPAVEEEIQARPKVHARVSGNVQGVG